MRMSIRLLYHLKHLLFRPHTGEKAHGCEGDVVVRRHQPLNARICLITLRRLPHRNGKRMLPCLQKALLPSLRGHTHAYLHCPHCTKSDEVGVNDDEFDRLQAITVYLTKSLKRTKV